MLPIAMILPSAKLQSAGIISLMQSTLNDTEKREQEAQKTREPSREDKMLKAYADHAKGLKDAKSKINQYFFSLSEDDPHALKVRLFKDLASRLGIDINTVGSSYKLGAEISDKLRKMPALEKEKLAIDLKLPKMGLTLDGLVKAILNPWGKDSSKVENAVSGANHTRTYSAQLDGQKVLQRLSKMSEKQTLEDLKVDKAFQDPGEIVDPETKAETNKDIAEKEASQKLNQARKQAETMTKVHQKQKDRQGGPAQTSSGLDQTTVITALASENASQVKAVREAGKGGQSSSKDKNNLDAPIEGNNQTELNIKLGQRLDAIDKQGKADTQANIHAEMTVELDETGAYKILRRKAESRNSGAGPSLQPTKN